MNLSSTCGIITYDKKGVIFISTVDINDTSKSHYYQEYDKEYLKFKKYVHDINEGTRKLTESNFERALERLGEVETFELPEGGLDFVPFGYKMAKDDEVATFIYVRTFYEGLIADTMEAAIKEVDEELVWHLVDLYEQAIKTRGEVFHIHRNPETLSRRLLYMYRKPSFTYYGRHVAFSEEAKMLLVKVLEHSAKLLNNEVLSDFTLLRRLTIEPTDTNLEIYRSVVDNNIKLLYNSKSLSRRKLQMLSPNERGNLDILGSAITDYCFIRRYDLAEQVANSMREYNQSIFERFEGYIEMYRKEYESGRD